MPFVFRKDEIDKSLRFKGIVVESVERVTEDGNEIWQMTIYNQATDKFIPAGSVRNVDPSSRGYGGSGLRQRLDAWQKVGVDSGSASDYVGYECEFETRFRDFQGQTSTRLLPTKKVGRVGSGELVGLQTRLATERENRQATSAVQAPAEYDEETIGLLGQLFEGRTVEEAQAAANKMKLPTTTLNDVMTGQAASVLIDRGLFDLDDDGRFVRQ